MVLHVVQILATHAFASHLIVTLKLVIVYIYGDVLLHLRFFFSGSDIEILNCSHSRYACFTTQHLLQVTIG